MIFDCTQLARIVQIWDNHFSSPVQFTGGGLWVGVLSSGQCSLADSVNSSAVAGSLLIGSGSLRLEPLVPCHLMAVRIDGEVPSLFIKSFPGSMFADGTSAPEAAQLLAMLATEPTTERAAGLCCQLLCELANADSAQSAYTLLVAQAVAAMRENYAELYGIDELSDNLNVSKSHLVRTFKEQVGITPGQYLTQVRINAAKQLLFHREYSLDVIASLCGFSGANYLCRVFKQHTGMTPTEFRTSSASLPAPSEPIPLENEMFV